MEVLLPDGECVTLRRLGEGDAESLLAFYDGLSEQTDWFYAPFTAADYTLAKMQEVVEHQRMGRRCDFVVESEAGEIVGHCFLDEFSQETPMLGIGLTDCYHGRRLGHALIGHVIDHARDALRAPGIRLDLNEDNPRAFHLYRKMGFVETGRKVVDRGAQGRFGHGRLVPMIDMVLRFPECPQDQSFPPAG